MSTKPNKSKIQKLKSAAAFLINKTNPLGWVVSILAVILRVFGQGELADKVGKAGAGLAIGCLALVCFCCITLMSMLMQTGLGIGQLLEVILEDCQEREANGENEIENGALAGLKTTGERSNVSRCLKSNAANQLVQRNPL